MFALQELAANLARTAGLKIRAVVAKIFTDLGVAANINGLEDCLDEDGALINDNKPKDGKAYRPPLVTVDGGGNLVKAFESRYCRLRQKYFHDLLLSDLYLVYHIYFIILPKMHFPKLHEQTHESDLLKNKVGNFTNSLLIIVYKSCLKQS